MVSKYILFGGICLSGYVPGFLQADNPIAGHARAPIFLFDGEIIADAHLYNKNSITGIIAPSNFLAAFLIIGLFSNIAISCAPCCLYNSIIS
jgi:hypothetical protein